MTARPQNGPPAPYVGLRPFEFQEAALFYGRGEHIAEMVRTLRERHFLAVLGSSGSGKSSLVRAGLLPTIAAGFMNNGEEAADWRFVIMRPGLDPYENLLRELLPKLAPDQTLDPKLIEFRRQTLRGGPRGLVEVVADSLLPEPARLIVLVDQFEEIFRFLERSGLSQPDDGGSLADRRNATLAFVDMLLATTAERDPHVYVVLTMRSEYLGECEAFLGLSAAVSKSQFLTPRMTREQIQDIIERPIAAVGGRIEPQVVTDLLNSLGTAHDQLPRVEHILLRMWSQARETRKNQPVCLTQDDYRGAGRFESALDEHAEQLYRELGPGAKAGQQSEKQRVAEQLFRSLAVRSSQGTLVRRLSSLGEVASIAGASEQIVAEVVEHFRQPGCNFVVATPSAPLTGKTTLDISHEALLRQWDRLRTWLEEEAQSAQIYLRLAETAVLHAKGKASLWRNPDLQLALDWRDSRQPGETWAARYHPQFKSAMHFLEASVALREGEKQGLDSDTMQRLGLFGYEIEERIGEGSFGIVYRARHVAQGRAVALKMLVGGAEQRGANRELLIRWTEEVGRWNHEGIVSVLEVHHEASPIFLVMEWMDGLPINVALKGADWNAKASAVAVVCDLIDYAHQRGVVHGGLKPTNVLVGPDGRPKILDYGLRRLLTDEGDIQRRSPSGTVGTALYLAPEQVAGGTTVGPAADVYTLGVILYELLTGEPPFAAYSLHRFLDAQLNDAPELPMLKCADVPEPLQRICLKALEKTPVDRYRSMSEMRDDLKRYLHGEPVSVRPSYYNNLIESPARGHVTEIDRWRKQALITNSEHVRLRRAYQSLTRSGLQAVGESRLIHRIVLLMYLGGWFVLAGAASWLALYYWAEDKVEADKILGLVSRPSGRVLVSLAPVLLTNLLWRFFNRRGSYRFAFAAMVLGLISLPFAVGVVVHETANRKGHEIAALKSVHWPVPKPPAKRKPQSDTKEQSETVSKPDEYQVFTDNRFPNIQLFIALLVAVVWDAYVARHSSTLTSATIVGLHFIALYLVGLDFWGLKYFFEAKISYGGFYMLPAAFAVVAAGLYVGQKLKRPSQAVPLFAIAMVVAILASQAIAIYGPGDRDWTHPEVKMGAIEVALGIAYFAFSRYLRDRFPIEAAGAYRVLAWLAPVAFLGGILIMDWYWQVDELWMFRFFHKHLTPWAPVLLASSIIVVLLAARVQSYFYISCGLGFLAYILDRIALETPEGWSWSFTILCIGLLLSAVMMWRDSRGRVGEDIDDVGELLIGRVQSRLGPSIRPSFAGLSSRITAYLLDLLIAFSVLIVAAITMRTLRAVGLWTPAPEQTWGAGAKLAIVSAFVVAGGPIYLILFEASPWQATFGKRILKIYVTNNEGRRISLARSFGRWLAMWFFGFFGGSLISLITIVTTKEKKALHDFAASTVVRSGRPTPGGNLEAWRIAAAFGISLLWIR